MARLQQLIPYLEQGCSLQSAVGEELVPIAPERGITYRHSNLKKPWAPPEREVLWLADVSQMHSTWEWGVLFVGTDKKEYAINNLAAIEEALNNHLPHSIYGELPK